MMTLVGHWSACLMFLVPMLNQFPNDSWVAINELQVTTWTLKIARLVTLELGDKL